MEPQRRTKIVCTLGPATQSPEAVAGLVAAGMDVARLNFSHGSRDEHAAIYGRVREASDASGRAVGILVDLQGPKIRLGTFDGESLPFAAFPHLQACYSQRQGSQQSGACNTAPERR